MLKITEIHKKIIYGNINERKEALIQLHNDFNRIPNKKQAWEDILHILRDKNNSLGQQAIYALGDAFQFIPNKEDAWNDLIQLIHDPKWKSFRRRVVMAQFAIFQHCPKKEKAWDDIVQLIYDEVTIIDSTFVDVPKEESMHQQMLTFDTPDDVLWATAASLGDIFHLIPIPNRKYASDILHYLTIQDNKQVKQQAVTSVGDVFQFISNKKQAYDDLHRLTLDQDNHIRQRAVKALGLAFQYIPNKKQALEKLHNLIKDDNTIVRALTAEALGVAFYHSPNQKQICEDVCKLSQDKEWRVRLQATKSLSAAYPNIFDNKKILNELIRLSKDENTFVRVYANYSLGKISIFNANKVESKVYFKLELRKALKFFEASTKEASSLKLGNFCFPFYRTFYTIIFKEGGEREVQQYLIDARKAAEGSENRTVLLYAVESLAKALEEVQETWELGLEATKSDLESYKIYCERAEKLLDDSEEIAPWAVKTIRKGLPIIDKKIKELIDKIGKDTKNLCDTAKGTKAEEYTTPTCKEIGELIKIKNPLEIKNHVIKRLIPNLIFMANNLPVRHRNFIYYNIENLRNEEFVDEMLDSLNEIILFITPYINLCNILDKIDNKLDEIKISLKSGISEELIVTVGAEIFGTGAQHVITIPLQDISYDDLKKDLEKIRGKSNINLTTLPSKLAETVKEYIRKKMNNILK